MDKLLEQISSFISSHDLTGLLELWKHLDSRIFTRLEASRYEPPQSTIFTWPRTPAVRKLENSLLKLYAVTCVSTKYSTLSFTYDQPFTFSSAPAPLLHPGSQKS